MNLIIVLGCLACFFYGILIGITYIIFFGGFSLERQMAKVDKVIARNCLMEKGQFLVVVFLLGKGVLALGIGIIRVGLIGIGIMIADEY